MKSGPRSVAGPGLGCGHQGVGPRSAGALTSLELGLHTLTLIHAYKLPLTGQGSVNPN